MEARGLPFLLICISSMLSGSLSPRNSFVRVMIHSRIVWVMNEKTAAGNDRLRFNAITSFVCL